MKRFIALFLCVVLITCMAVPVYAAENENTIVPFASSPPTSSHSTTYMATITNLEAGHLTYTKYYFAPTGEDLETYGVFNLTTDSDTSVSYRVKINLYRVGSSTIEDSYTTGYFTSSYGFTHTFFNLDPDAYYYFTFQNITASSALKNRSVEGNVYIA